VREGVPPGSLRHLAILFSGSPERLLIEAIYAFEAELRRIVAAASHEAAHARLQWWRSELDRLAAGRPTHPLAQALLPLRDQPDADASLLHEMLVAADLDLARLTYATWQELEAYLFRSAGVPQTLIAATLSSRRGLQPAGRDFARRLGAAVRQTEIIVDLDRDLARGRLYAPLQALEAAGIDPQALAGQTASDDAHAFLNDWSCRVHAELEALPGLLDDPVQRGEQRHGLVLAALHARWLERRRRLQGVAGARTELSPVTRLWTAWRTAVSHS
jgi:phytoene synthase